MKIVYTFPLQCFIILEKININIWSHWKKNFNNFFLLLNFKNVLSLVNIINYEYFLNKSILVDHSVITIYQKKNNFFLINFLSLKNISWYMFFFFSLKIKINLFVINMKSFFYFSLDKIFKNSNWLERESSEMYKIQYFLKTDKRNLLLEYSKIEYGLEKSYYSEGIYDIYYNFFENSIFINKNYSIEL